MCYELWWDIVWYSVKLSAMFRVVCRGQNKGLVKNSLILRTGTCLSSSLKVHKSPRITELLSGVLARLDHHGRCWSNVKGEIHSFEESVALNKEDNAFISRCCSARKMISFIIQTSPLSGIQHTNKDFPYNSHLSFIRHPFTSQCQSRIPSQHIYIYSAHHLRPFVFSFSATEAWRHIKYLTNL